MAALRLSLVSHIATTDNLDDVWELTSPPRLGSQSAARVWVVEGQHARQASDRVATEEPLEMRLRAGAARRTLAITMRTPGADFELAVGFLYGEGVVANREQIRHISYCVDPAVDPEQRYNIVNVDLRADELPPVEGLDRHFYTTSACGICGKASLAALHVGGCSTLTSGPTVAPELIYGLPQILKSRQGIFKSTGGLHAAALFDSAGDLVAVREDVGRHNALDKLIGWAVMEGRVPLADHIVLVSGRASYELVQKCVSAGVPLMCAISAPSSLAVAVAQEFGMTLVGFLRGERFNIYAGRERIRTAT